MVVKVYVSGISGNKEVKKRQQRVLMILDSKNIKYEVFDIAEPGNEEAKEFMQSNAKSLGATIGDANPRHPLPPQVFSDDEYCGDYDQFDLANENDEIEKFLKLPYDDSGDTVTSTVELKLGNGEINTTENLQNENEAEAVVKDVQEVTQNEEPKEDNEVTGTNTIEESETKLESEAEHDNKLENGSADADSAPTDVAA